MDYFLDILSFKFVLQIADIFRVIHFSVGYRANAKTDHSPTNIQLSYSSVTNPGRYSILH